ncbi:Uncharacterised protein [Burkholderia pseudomallei]|nr:Uncharacterised protein [Burkholderia pseudomallei]
MTSTEGNAFVTAVTSPATGRNAVITDVVAPMPCASCCSGISA